MNYDDAPPHLKAACDALIAAFNEHVLTLDDNADVWNVMENFVSEVVVNALNLPVMAAAADLVKSCRIKEDYNAKRRSS